MILAQKSIYIFIMDQKKRKAIDLQRYGSLSFYRAIQYLGSAMREEMILLTNCACTARKPQDGKESQKQYFLPGAKIKLQGIIYLNVRAKDIKFLEQGLR